MPKYQKSPPRFSFLKRFPRLRPKEFWLQTLFLLREITRRNHVSKRSHRSVAWV